jgi:hypothetical protein
MKFFFIVLLLVAGMLVAYDLWLAAPGEALVFKRHDAEQSGAESAVKKGAEPSRSAPAKTKAGESVKPKPAEPAPPSDGFVPPKIETLAELTQDWRVIPPRAFPRPVVLAEPVAFQMAAGSSQVPAGATVIALGADNGVLTVAPSETSAARGQARLEATDFRAQIESAYETWRQEKLRQAREAWEERRKLAADGRGLVAVAREGALEPGGKPVRNASGSYDLLLESMHIRQVNEIQPQKVTRWGSARPAEVDGKPGWRVDIEFRTMTLFGEFDVAAHAEILDGRLVRWIYTGSGEEVP